MAAEAGLVLHPRPQRVFPAQDGHHRHVFDNLAAQGVGRLPAGDEDGGALVADPPFQVVKDAAVFHHAAGADDDRRHGQHRDLLGLLDISGVAEGFEAEGVVVGVSEEEASGLGVIRLRVEAEDVGDAGGQGAVDIDRQGRNPPFLEQLVQAVDDLLGSPHRKGGDQQGAAPAGGFVDDRGQAVLGGLIGGMALVAVGGLHDQDVRPVGGRGRIADDGDVGAADVAAVEQPLPPAGVMVVDVEDDVGAAQDVAGVDHGQVDAGKDLSAPVVAEADELLHGRDHVLLGVERFEEDLVLGAALLAVDVFDVALLDGGAVHQHRRAQVAGGGGGVDVAAEAVLHQAGNGAGVVDMGVGEDHRVDGGGVAEILAVARKRLLAAALE